MLNREDIINYINNTDLLEKDGYWVLAGAALVIHGVKEETRDIDLGCTTELADKLVTAGCKYEVGDSNKRIIKLNDTVEIFENWLVDEIEIINEVPVGSLNSIKKHKLELGREKDLADIKLIEKKLLEI